MPQKIINFLKYNNATIIIIVVLLIFGAGVFAAGPDAIGQKQTQIKGIDNTLLLTIELDNFNMDFKIQSIEQDDQYYYVAYTYLDLAVIKQAWQYQLNQKTVKISKKIREDVGVYMAKYLAKHYEARIRELKQEKSIALINGEQKRIEVTEYTGLIGKTLDLASEIFPGYEPIKKVILPMQENFNLPDVNSGAPSNSETDNLNEIYNDYVADHPEIFETSTDTASSSLDVVNAEQILEVQHISEPTNVNVIELPTTEPIVSETTSEPATESAQVAE